ncbi:hypothetical protein SRHO_G00174600 [Serrasalmus rhombeus]
MECISNVVSQKPIQHPVGFGACQARSERCEGLRPPGLPRLLLMFQSEFLHCCIAQHAAPRSAPLLLRRADGWSGEQCN